MWIYQEESLARDWTVISPDLPGFGRSSSLPGPFDLGRYVDETRVLIDELGLDGVTIASFAFGGVVAMSLAAADPKGIAGLILMGIPSAREAPYDRMPKAMRRDWPEFARRSARAICKGPHSDATFAWLEGIYAATDLAVAVETCAILGAFEPGDIAATVDVPTLFIHGALDDVVPVDVARACHRLIAGSRLEVVADSGHLVTLDQKERTSELIEEFARALA